MNAPDRIQKTKASLRLGHNFEALLERNFPRVLHVIDR
jgi:hypothetical protein